MMCHLLCLIDIVKHLFISVFLGVLGDAVHREQAQRSNIPFQSVEDALQTALHLIAKCRKELDVESQKLILIHHWNLKCERMQNSLK